jgi:hypothetical protein
MLYIKSSFLTLVMIIFSACVVSSPITKKEGLFQYVTLDAHVVNSYPANSFSEAKKVINLKTSYMRLLFEQSHEPVFGTPKWTDECIKANNIGDAHIDGEEIYAISELFVHFNGSLGHCHEGPRVFKAHHILVYCPVYKEVIEYKFSLNPTLNFQKIDLCK